MAGEAACPPLPEALAPPEPGGLHQVGAPQPPKAAELFPASPQPGATPASPRGGWQEPGGCGGGAGGRVDGHSPAAHKDRGGEWMVALMHPGPF